MTLIVALEQLQPRPDRHASTRAPPRSGRSRSTSPRRADQRRRSRQGGADPVRQRRRRRARARDRAELPGLRGLMNAKARQLGLTDTPLRPARRARRARRVLERARRHPARAGRDADPGRPARPSDQQTATYRRRTRPAHLERPARRLPRASSGSRPATPGGRLVPGGRGARRRGRRST